MIFLSAAVFLGVLLAARRSLGAGMSAVLVVGYAYGITRANLAHPLAHVLFDIAVVALYSAQLLRPVPRAERAVVDGARKWLIVLCSWPVVIFCLYPQRDPLVELVGLRGNIFLLPFLFLGARMSAADTILFTRTIAVLNLAAGGLAAAQYVFGLEPFFPYNEVTALIYRSNDLVGRTSYRLPSSFPNAHVFGGTMVVTLPWLIGALMKPGRTWWQTALYVSALVSSVLSVFATGARTPIVVLGTVAIATTIFSSFRGHSILRWAMVAGLVGYVVSGDPRLQRFVTLGDTTMLQERIAGSVNKDFFDLVAEYPLGKGLAGGGTSIPYFLQDRQQIQMTLENEYARIVLELGTPGLLLWMAFILWLSTRRTGDPADPWYVAQRVAWVAGLGYFVVALTGIGLLSAVPQSAVLLLNLGWAVAAARRARIRRLLTPARPQTAARVA